MCVYDWCDLIKILIDVKLLLISLQWIYEIWIWTVVGADMLHDRDWTKKCASANICDSSLLSIDKGSFLLQRTKLDRIFLGKYPAFALIKNNLLCLYFIGACAWAWRVWMRISDNWMRSQNLYCHTYTSYWACLHVSHIIFYIIEFNLPRASVSGYWKGFVGRVAHPGEWGVCSIRCLMFDVVIHGLLFIYSQSLSIFIFQLLFFVIPLL